MVHVVDDVSVSPVIRMIHGCESCHTCVSAHVVDDVSVSPVIRMCVCLCESCHTCASAHVVDVCVCPLIPIIHMCALHRLVSHVCALDTLSTAYCIWSVVESQSQISISLVSFQRNVVKETWRTLSSIKI